MSILYIQKYKFDNSFSFITVRSKESNEKWNML